MKKISFFIIFVMMFGSGASAANSASVYKETVKNAYVITKDLCSGTSLTDYEVFEIIKNSRESYRLNSPKESDAMFVMGMANGLRTGKWWNNQFSLAWQSFKHSIEQTFTMDEEYLRVAEGMNSSITPELLGLLDSEGFHQALRECYGSNQAAKNQFTIELLAADRGGAIMGFLLPGLALFKGIRSLKASYIGVRYARQVKYAEYTLNTAIIAPPLWYLGQMAYLQYKIKKIERKIQESFVNPCNNELPSSFSQQEFDEAEKNVLQQISNLKKELNAIHAKEALGEELYNKYQEDLSRKESLIQKLSESKKAITVQCSSHKA